jgi:iron complex outermembrane receptor protein
VGTVHAQALPDTASQAQASRRNYDIPAGSLAPALRSFASAANLPLSFVPDQTEGKRTAGVRGQFTQQEALAALLAGSGLLAVRLDSGGYVLRNQPTPAEPASAADGRLLPAVHVTATAERETATGPMLGYAARISATATKTDTPLIEVPQSISVIGRKEIETRGTQDVMEVLRYTPGVTTNTYGPDNRGWEYILLRGFDAGVTGIYRDGLSQPAFVPTYYLTEPYALERVEVLRGPSSMIFGKADAGGVVNRVSKQPGERVREIEVQYGSFQRKQLAFDLGDQIGGNTDLSYRLVGVGLDSNEQSRYPDGHQLNRTRTYLAPSVRWQPNAQTSLTVFAEFLNNNTAEDPYYLGQNGISTRVKVGDYSFGQLKQKQSALGYRFETALSDNWTLRQNFSYTDVDQSRRAVWADSVNEDGHTLARVARTWNDPMKVTAMDTNVQGKLSLGSVQHTVLLGVDYTEQKGKQRRFRGPAPDLELNLFPVYGQFIPTPTRPLSNLAQSTRQIGFYAQDQIKFDEHWLLTVGGRQDHVRQITDNYLETTRTRASDSAFTGRAGLNYLFSNGWTPYLSYATSFLPNSGADANSEPFKPSRGKQVEVGVKYQPPGTKSLFTAAVFDLRKTNVVTSDPLTFEQRQIGKQRSRGIELEAKGELAPGLNIAASYTWLDMKVLASADPGEVGKIPPLVPKQSASVWLDYTMGNGIGFGGGVRYIGKRQNDETNSSAERGVTLFDAVVSYERGPWRFALNVTNLANKKYNSICYHGECYQGMDRAATLTARYRWQ